MALCLTIFAGCAGGKPAVVVAPMEVRPRVPAALIVPCPAPDRRQWRTTRDIIASVDSNEAALKTCAAQVDGVRTWDQAGAENGKQQH